MCPEGGIKHLTPTFLSPLCKTQDQARRLISAMEKLPVLLSVMEKVEFNQVEIKEWFRELKEERKAAVVNTQAGGSGANDQAIVEAAQRRAMLSNNKKRETKAKGGGTAKKARKGNKNPVKEAGAAVKKSKVSVCQ